MQKFTRFGLIHLKAQQIPQLAGKDDDGDGQIDEDLLFYLRARGLPEAQARALLIQAFVGETFEALDDEVIGDAFGEVAADWLGVKLD